MSSQDVWVVTWLGEAPLAFAIGAWAMFQKAKAVKAPLLYGPGRKFALSLCPAMIAGAVFTAVLYANDLYHLMPGTWLLLYGVAVVAGGVFSVRVVPLMGGCFMAVGTVALFAPVTWANVFMALGFGIQHIIFGAVIARRYGG